MQNRAMASIIPLPSCRSRYVTRSQRLSWHVCKRVDRACAQCLKGEWKMLESPCLGLDISDQAKLAFCVLLVTVAFLLENIWARSMVPRVMEPAASPIPTLVICLRSYVYGSSFLSCRLQVVYFVWAHRLHLGFAQVLRSSLQETICNSYTVSCLQKLDLEIKQQV